MSAVLAAVGIAGVEADAAIRGVAHVAVVQTERVCACGIFGVEELRILAVGDIVRADVVGVRHGTVQVPVAGSLALPGLPTGDQCDRDGARASAANATSMVRKTTMCLLME